MIAVDCALVCPFPMHHWTKPQRIHDCQRTRAHGKDVPQNPANPGGCALKRFDKRRMVMRFDLKGAGPAIAYVYDPGIFAGPLHYKTAARGQAFQVYARRFIRAMLAPHHAEDAQFGQ